MSQVFLVVVVFFFFLIGENYMRMGERLKVGRIISENIWVPLQISR